MLINFTEQWFRRKYKRKNNIRKEHIHSAVADGRHCCLQKKHDAQGGSGSLQVQIFLYFIIGKKNSYKIGSGQMKG